MFDKAKAESKGKNNSWTIPDKSTNSSLAKTQFEMSTAKMSTSSGIEYRVYQKDDGWSGWVKEGPVGSGRSVLPIEAIQIRIVN